ncbi:unnamed protein product [Adineta steineri]|uniref:Uncharacterized protein n=1 Tax=Adineta steineri TaxID=433720 RepID=A0A818L8L8_9BILA|nr:unnamed protein product [Adineta steineri]CAF3570051.1 unnamed protein product [Adineta steineri]
MSILSNTVFILLVFSSTFSWSQQNDNICQINGGILCVKDELTIITTIAKGVKHISNKIERYIKQTKTVQTLERYFHLEMNSTGRNLPSSEYHDHFFQYSNINKEYLVKLFLEAHNALVYYYNSIEDLLNLEGVYAEESDERFRKIHDNIKYEMICRYRNILNVYSGKWKSVNEVNDRIQFTRGYRLSPSEIHNIRSIIIARNVRKWTEIIQNVTDNLGYKFG